MRLEPRRIQIARPDIGDEEWQALREPVETGWLTHGPKVKEFEQAFAARHSVTRAVATTSCTTALHLALTALGIGPDDEVIVPAFTWIATPNAVLYCGATPVFADVDPVTFNIDPDKIAAAVTDRTKAAIPVHLFGLCAEMNAISAVLPPMTDLIEDAACAAGAVYRGRSAGALGRAACFSFHPRKSITTGEGGMVTTNDGGLADTLERLRNHGAEVSEEQRHLGSAPYLLPEFNEIGFNYRMTDLQGAIGCVQLSKLDGYISERERWARWYAEELSDLGWLRTPEHPLDGQHAWQSYVTVVTDKAPMERDEIMACLHDRNIDTRPGTHAVTTLGAYRSRFDVGPETHPVAAELQRTTMALPLHNRMSQDDYLYVVDALHQL